MGRAASPLGPNEPDLEFIFALADYNNTPTALILREDDTYTSVKKTLIPHTPHLYLLTSTRVHVNRSTNVVISGSCQPQPDGGVLLSMAIDNKSLDATRSPVHWTSFDGIGIYLLSAIGPAKIAVDDLHVGRNHARPKYLPRIERLIAALSRRIVCLSRRCFGPSIAQWQRPCRVDSTAEALRTNVVVDRFDLAGVDSRADLEVKRINSLRERMTHVCRDS